MQDKILIVEKKKKEIEFCLTGIPAEMETYRTHWTKSSYK